MRPILMGTVVMRRPGFMMQWARMSLDESVLALKDPPPYDVLYYRMRRSVEHAPLIPEPCEATAAPEVIEDE